MKLTEQRIDAGRSERGGWSRKQLALLGVDWPPKTGWKQRVIGDEISEDKYRQFLRLKG